MTKKHVTKVTLLSQLKHLKKPSTTHKTLKKYLKILSQTSLPPKPLKTTIKYLCDKKSRGFVLFFLRIAVIIYI